jgi:hypothetical protein
MILNKCKHEWEKNADATRQLDVGAIGAFFMCKKCRTVMTASDVLQLEILSEIKGWQRWLSISAIVISFFALIISILR